jgi:hypothetical protein
MKNILVYPDRRTFKILPESEIQSALEEGCLNNPHHKGGGSLFSDSIYDGPQGRHFR